MMSDLIGMGGADGAATPQAPGADALVKEANMENFMAEVVEASTKMPIIVDFWASWCGPCKTLGPMLEKAIIARKGAMIMVKVDIDKNQMLAQQLRIQSVPTVMAFINGQPVDGFAGALPESEINTFLDRVAQAAQAAGLAGGNGGVDLSAALEAAEQAMEQGDVATASGIFSQIAETAPAQDPLRLKALAGMARCYIQMEELTQAQAVLDLVPEAKRSDPTITQAFAALELATNKPDQGALEAARKAAEAAKDDQQAQYAYAEALMGAGEMEKAADILLTQIAQDRDWEGGKAREKLLTIFEALGPKDPITLAARRRLSAILFS